MHYSYVPAKRESMIVFKKQWHETSTMTECVEEVPATVFLLIIVHVLFLISLQAKLKVLWST